MNLGLIDKFKDKFDELSPRQKQIAVLAMIVGGLLVFSLIIALAMGGGESQSRAARNRKVDTNLLTGKETKGLKEEALANQVKTLQAEIDAIKTGKTIPGQMNNIPGSKDYRPPAAGLDQSGQPLPPSPAGLQIPPPPVPPEILGGDPALGGAGGVPLPAAGKRSLPPPPSRDGGGVQFGNGDMPLELPGVVPPPRRKKSESNPVDSLDPSVRRELEKEGRFNPKGGGFEIPPQTGGKSGSSGGFSGGPMDGPVSGPGDHKPESRELEIKVFKEEKRADSGGSKGGSGGSSDKSIFGGGKQQKENVVHLPAGSIFSGTLLTGGDFPTSSQGRKDPFPALLRVKHEALLPNRFRMDFRECFIIASGYGDMSSERAYLRAETLSCVRNDGAVIETGLNAYATGPEGKAGIPGRLVSKTGTLLARGLMAGFMSGVAEAVKPQPINAIATGVPGADTSFQKPNVDDAVQSGAWQGASNAMSKIADYYVEMAKNVFPTIEINPGQPIDFIAIKGTKLSVQSKGEKQQRQRGGK